MKTATFSHIPAFTTEQIEEQIGYFLDHDCVIGVEYTTQPNPSLTFWNWWKPPLYTLPTVNEVMTEIEACKAKNPEGCIRLTIYDKAHQTQVMNFVVHRPES